MQLIKYACIQKLVSFIFSEMKNYPLYFSLPVDFFFERQREWNTSESRPKSRISRYLFTFCGFISGATWFMIHKPVHVDFHRYMRRRYCAECTYVKCPRSYILFLQTYRVLKIANYREWQIISQCMYQSIWIKFSSYYRLKTNFHFVLNAK